VESKTATLGEDEVRQTLIKSKIKVLQRTLKPGERQCWRWANHAWQSKASSQWAR